LRLIVIVATLTIVSAGCMSTARNAVPPGTIQPDRYLFDRGSEALKERKWLTAREFFRQLTETYTQSPLRPDAKLAIGDTFIGEGTTEALVLGINEFQEFLSFYPTNPRADYAQYKLGFCYYRQMRAPDRDQTETKNAVREFETFLARYPNSSLLPEVQAKLREARDNVSEADFRVGRFYFRVQWYPGAIDRLTTVLKSDPGFSRRDGVYFYLAEALVKANRGAEALPYYERISSEFEQSEYLEEARKRIAELKALAEAKKSV
jgi:outer membrane protein assembly factor BamD